MKKLLSILLIMSFAFSMTACSKKSDKYLIATDTTFAPFEFEENGEIVGIDMDILKAISEDQGFEYEIQPVGFNAAVVALESKQVDGVIAGMSINAERQKKYDFSAPYYDSSVVMAVSKNSSVKSYEDLSGKSVAVKTGTEGSVFAESIKEQYGFNCVYFDESANMYQDVISGNSAACFEDYPVVAYAIKKGMQLELPANKEKGNSYGFAVYKGENKELLDMFNKGLENIKQNGKYQEIIDKYTKE